MAGVVVREVAFKGELATLSALARALGGGAELRARPQSVLYLLHLLGLHVDGLVDAFAVLHLLRFVSVRDGS